MTTLAELSDLELASLISSKICHDVIGPVGAIYNGLEVLDEDPDASSREYALDVIRDFTTQASAKLQFARFAFGAAGSAGTLIDLREAANIAANFVGQGKHQLVWAAPPGQLPKDQVKLLLNMVASAITALPRGGSITVATGGDPQRPMMTVTCEGTSARAPQYLGDFVNGSAEIGLDALTVQPYYTYRLAVASGMALVIETADETVVLKAIPAA